VTEKKPHRTVQLSALCVTGTASHIAMHNLGSIKQDCNT